MCEADGFALNVDIGQGRSGERHRSILGVCRNKGKAAVLPIQIDAF